MHGHSYRVELKLEGPVDPHSGFVVDFFDIEQAFAPLLEDARPSLPERDRRARKSDRGIDRGLDLRSGEEGAAAALPASSSMRRRIATPNIMGRRAAHSPASALPAILNGLAESYPNGIEDEGAGMPQIGAGSVRFSRSDAGIKRGEAHKSVVVETIGSLQARDIDDLKLCFQRRLLNPRIIDIERADPLPVAGEPARNRQCHVTA